MAPLSLPETDPRSVVQATPVQAAPEGSEHEMLIDDLVRVVIDEGFAERVHDEPALGSDAIALPVGAIRAAFAKPKRASTSNTENIDKPFFMYTTLSYFVFYLFIILVPV